MSTMLRASIADQGAGVFVVKQVAGLSSSSWK